MKRKIKLLLLLIFLLALVGGLLFLLLVDIPAPQQPIRQELNHDLFLQ